MAGIENINSVKRDAKYWKRMAEKYTLMVSSLERQLVELDAFSSDWEECYSLLLDTQDKLEEASRNKIQARVAEFETNNPLR